MRWHVVVTGATSSAQLVHVSARLRRILALRWCTQLTVVVVPHRGATADPATAESAAPVLPSDPRLRVVTAGGLRQWRFPTDEWAIHVAVGAAGLADHPAIAAANPGRRIPVVVTDQDLDSYGEVDAPLDPWAHHGGARRTRSLTRLVGLWGRQSVEVERWPLHCRVDGRWVVNECVAEEFRARTGPVPVDQQRVVMLTQPWSRSDGVSMARHRAHVREVGRTIRRDGRTLSVRPHPTHDLRCYDGLELDGIEVLDPAGPAELDPEVVAASEVIGAPSASLLTVAAVYRRPARIVAPSVAEAMSRLTGDQRALVEAHTTQTCSDEADRPALTAL